VIFLDTVRPLPVPAAGKPHIVTEGIFKNEDSRDFLVVLFDNAGRMYAELPVTAHHTNGTGIRKGTAEIKSDAGKTVIWRGTLSQEDTKYLDIVGHKYYFRIVNGKIERVTPTEAERWFR
jgi:hypothetical protein